MFLVEQIYKSNKKSIALRLMESIMELEETLVEQFSANLWRAGNTVVLGIFALAFGAYAFVFSHHDYDWIESIIRDHQFFIYGFAIFGNLLLMFGIWRIGKLHKTLISEHTDNKYLLTLVRRATIFGIQQC